MSANIRQGLIVPDTSSNYLQFNASGNIDLIVDDPIRVTLAHGSADYLIEEESSLLEAWMGDFQNDQSYWFYWDIDLLTAQVSYQYTQVEPSFGTTLPSSPVVDQHFFDKSDVYMKVWDGAFWIKRIRVFAGSLINGQLSLTGNTSQVDIFGIFQPEPIKLFKTSEPIRKELNDGNFVFVTEISGFGGNSQQIDNFRYTGLDNSIAAGEDIPQYRIVTIGSGNVLQLATNNDNTSEAYGVTEEAISTGEFKNVVTRGFIRDIDIFDFTEPPNTPLYVGESGQLTTVLNATALSIQKVGYIVSPDVIYVDIGPYIIVAGATPLPASPTPTPTETVTPTPSPIVSVTPSNTPAASVTPTPSNTAAVTVTPTGTPLSTVTPTATSTPAPASPTPTVTASVTATPTPTATVSITPTSAVTSTPDPTVTATVTPTVTETPPPPSLTPTPTPSGAAPGPVSTGFIGGTFNDILSFPFSAPGNSIVGSILPEPSNASRSNFGSVASTTLGYMVGGTSTGTTDISTFPFASPFASLTNIGDLTKVRQRAGGTQSPTHGYTAGGQGAPPTFPAPANYLDIESFPFASPFTTATLEGTMGLYHAGAASMQTEFFGYLAGGFSPPNAFPAGTGKVTRFPFTSPLAVGVEIGDLTASVSNAGGVSSATDGYIAGGSTVQSFPFPGPFGTSVTVGNLVPLAPTTYFGGMQNDTDGFIAPASNDREIHTFPFAAPFANAVVYVPFLSQPQINSSDGWSG